MGFKEQKWSGLNYFRNGTILKIEVLNETKGKLDTYRSKTPEQHRNVSKILLTKYGINLNPTIPSEKSINNINKEKTKEKQKEENIFLKKDMTWD